MHKSFGELFQLAKSQYERGQLPLAEQTARLALEADTTQLEARLLLGIILTKTKRFEAAAQELEQVLNVDENHYSALTWLALTRKSQNAFEEAIRLSKRAIALNDSDVTALNTLGLCQLSMRIPVDAIATFRRVLELDPQSGACYHNLGLALRLNDQTALAIDAFKKAVELAPDRIENYVRLSEVLAVFSAWNDVVVCLKEGLRRHPNSVNLMVTLANAYGSARNAEAAEELFKRARDLDPAASQAYGLWLQEQDRFEDSMDVFAESLRLRPNQGRAYYGLAEAKRFTLDGERLIDRMLKVLEQPNLNTSDRMHLAYALGKAFDQEKNYEQAVRYFDLANEAAFRIFNAGRPFDPRVGHAYTNGLKHIYSAENLARYRKHGSESEVPIMIVGMIRSGTTLLEQIVSSHPEVDPAGELNYWMVEGGKTHLKWRTQVDASDIRRLSEDFLMVLRTVGGDAPRVTDKMPLNYEHLGLIHIAFPNARILHIRRNPVDTCLSIYMTHFGGGPGFAYRQESIVAYYLEYMRLMEHWRAVLPPDRFYELDYEDLIADRESVTREIIDFCGLPWDDACLHHEHNPSAINTPSRWQARQPIYTTSVERWRRYEPWLGGLLKLRDVQHPSLRPFPLSPASNPS
jgi:tetratricopeptide (TPR) repeat protein